VCVFRFGSTKIFVGNIRDGTTSEQLRELFECYGRVAECDVLTGFGFVVSSLFIFWQFRLICQYAITGGLTFLLCFFSTEFIVTLFSISVIFQTDLPWISLKTGLDFL